MPTYSLLQPHQFEHFLAWRSRGDAYMLEVLQREFQLLEAGKNLCFVAIESGQFIATVQLVFSSPNLGLEFANGVESAYVQALEVSLEHRQKGIGKGLMAYLEAVARQRNFKRLTLMVEPDNQAAIGLYSHLGYSEFGRSFWTWKGLDHPTICLEKRL